MTTLFYILGYLAVAGFICMAYLKIRSYMASSPLHVRWELYPVPHEGSKTVYGGSFMEEKDWWTKPRHISHWGDIKALLTEVLFLHATFEHNLKLWVRSYPFHVGMYMLMGGTIIVLCAVFAQLFGLNPQGGFMIFVGNIINAVVLVGTLCIIIGGIGLIERRRNDEGLRRYSTPEHYFNLVIFIVFGLLGLAAWAFSPSYFELARTFIYNLITFNFAPQTSVLFSLHLLIGFFLLIWIPMTHMGHVFMKYFTYHDIRWGDEPTSSSDKNKAKILEALKFNVTWSAKHIAGDGTPKSWVDVATTNPTEKKED
ncbi:respiratory nitrate reductase subunit gamma [Desulfovibrio intestinalis]|uniref:Nitrate reductase gamma subunit n=1 Tax=Desulfovibrio intestinalis TaxID=58621 RepID=A0A7W8BYN2_9BACT|nr:respiratory nitrate reductase subunit gamma [Desulfovibrio intestinalis]MBB5142357.1 nitrate reductase gamma subunit [Desulfovibrio intestinalis]